MADGKRVIFLFALETVDLVPQALVLLLSGTQVGRQVFDQVQQADKQRASAFVELSDLLRARSTP